MGQEKRGGGEEEVARVRSYLASQAMRRTPEELVEALREAHRQFLAATAAGPDHAFRTIPGEGAWSAADVLAHVHSIAALDERSICGVIERGEQPANMDDALERAPTDATREQMLADIGALREGLIAVVLQADPQAHLDIVWEPNDFANMTWPHYCL